MLVKDVKLYVIRNRKNGLYVHGFELVPMRKKINYIYENKRPLGFTDKQDCENVIKRLNKSVSYDKYVLEVKNG